MAKSTAEAFRASVPKTSSAQRRRTSSRASAPGPTRSGSQAGLTIGRSGPDPALASLSAPPGKRKGSLTSAISGPHGSGSSKSADLQRSLESRLRVLTDSAGSTLFVLTWKGRATPLGRRICALRALAPRTSGNDYSSWPTPVASRGDYSYDHGTHTIKSLKLPGVAKLAAWPTPKRQDSTGARTPEQIDRHRAAGHGASNLHETVRLASWATPAAREAGGAPDQFLARKRKATSNGAQLGISLTSLSMQAQLAGWLTPKSSDARADLLLPGVIRRLQNQQQIGTAMQARLAVSGGGADWIFCRDGKWRAVEPGTFPLAHGVAARVGKLRAFGNAISPQVAATFIRAAMEAA